MTGRTGTQASTDYPLTVTADDGVGLAGTLTLPGTPGPHPAVLFLPGSGRVDRDSNAGRLRPGLGPALAAALAEHNIASYRYDRRGAADTPGDWYQVGFHQNRLDAAAALRALRVHPGIDAVAVIGHSEGAIHATTLAAHHNPAAAVLLAGYARPGHDILRWQAASMVGHLPAPLRAIASRLGPFAARQIERISESTTDVLRIGPSRLNAHWFREQLAHDPRPDLGAIRVPLLAITGDSDLQVDPGDLEVMARLVPHAETRRIPGLTHVLRRDTRRPSPLAYPRLLRMPTDPALLTAVATWLAAHLHP
ncbi:alpha/beta hydrolase [Actinoplanes sp. NBRC 103695]|uniref:alpha/beta hydrolase family protein n=1 Tax=Actinoplanes sp. NBRC 103695 TaxID=3032202 RepID=UPI0024A1C579|nr:alpha/beta hydrolase [Actinoplanes sp. NBRC 103695]GLY98330.1 acyl-CoA thioester hydrolase [Actinoplanes sp. NBRC 103695]